MDPYQLIIFPKDFYPFVSIFFRKLYLRQSAHIGKREFFVVENLEHNSKIRYNDKKWVFLKEHRKETKRENENKHALVAFLTVSKN